MLVNWYNANTKPHAGMGGEILGRVASNSTTPHACLNDHTDYFKVVRLSSPSSHEHL